MTYVDKHLATGTAVLLSALTTMVTFGSLGLSANRGLASIGYLSFFGIGGCLLAALYVLPAVLELRARRRTRTRSAAETGS